MENIFTCPRCKKGLEPECFEWSEDTTDAGTSFFHIYIECPCGWMNSAGGWGSYPVSGKEQKETLAELWDEISEKK